VSDLKQIPVITMPTFNVLSMIHDDSIRSINGNKSLRFAKSFEVKIDLKLQALMEVISDSGKIWRLGIKSSGAYSLNIIFSDFELPPNAELYIYSSDRQNLIGAFTNENNQKSKSFATSPVKGDEVFVELFEPNNVEFSSHTVIGQVNHDYKNIFNLLNEKGTCCGYNHSDSCEINSICSQYNNWQSEKRSVCRIIINGAGYCSGALVNNTAQDGTPYFLTANHCYEGYTDLNAAANNTIFYFNYESPTCTNQDGSTAQQISGATYKANWAASDFFLLQLNTPPPTYYNAYYSGWDQTNTAASSETGIHHPEGDVKKISTSSNAVTSTAYISNTSDNNANHWRIIWTSGVTEPGSSGSPLYNQNHRIVGQLHGGYSDCTANGSYGPTQPDWYGKLSSSWIGGSTPSTQLSHWLDPCGLGVPTLDGNYYPSISGPTLVCSSGGTFTVSYVPPGFTVYWDKSSNITLPTDRTTNPIVATANGNGSGWVQASINSTTCGSVTLPQYTVWVGNPIPANIQGPSQLPVGCIVNYSISAQGSPTSYQWSMAGRIICPPNQQWSYLYGDHTSTATLFAGCQSRYIGVTVGNQCGTAYVGKYVEIGNYNCNGGMKMLTDTTIKEPGIDTKEDLVIYPNPASDNVQVSVIQPAISTQNSVLSTATADQSVSITYSVKVFNIYGTLVYTLNNISSPFTIPLSGFNDGNYIIIVSDNNNTFQKQLIIKH
jgi:lysyl endopeptidase